MQQLVLFQDMPLLNIHHISHKMKQDIPKGASNKVDLIAAQIIDKHGIETLDLISKTF